MLPVMNPITNWDEGSRHTRGHLCWLGGCQFHMTPSWILTIFPVMPFYSSPLKVGVRKNSLILTTVPACWEDDAQTLQARFLWKNKMTDMAPQKPTLTPCHKALSTWLLASSKPARERVCLYHGHYHRMCCSQVYVRIHACIHMSCYFCWS